MNDVGWSRRLPFVAFVFTILVLSGCSPSPVDVSGTIKIKGQAPNRQGIQIVFLAPNGQMVSAPINADGTYVASSVPVGEAKVSFVYEPTDGNSPPKQKGRMPPKGAPTEDVSKKKDANPIPDTLRDGSSSKITFKVVGGKPNQFDYDISP